MGSRGIYGLLVVGAATLATLAAMWLRIGPAPLADLPASWDGHVYVDMAHQLSPCVEAPFCWRPLAPVLAGWIALPAPAAFVLVTWSGIVAATIATFVLFSGEFGRRAGYAAAALFLSLHWGSSFLVAYPWLTDAWLFACVVVAVIGVRRRSVAVYVAATVVGVLFKETALTVAMLAYGLTAVRPFDVRAAVRVAAATVPAVAVAVAIRILLPGDGGSLGAALQHGVRRIVDPVAWDLYAYTAGTWGLLVLVLAVVGTRRRPDRAWRLGPFVVAVYAQLLVAANDTRLLFLAFPAVLWLALVGLQELLPAHRLVPTTVAVTTATVVMRSGMDPSLYVDAAAVAVFMMGWRVAARGGLQAAAIDCAVSGVSERSPVDRSKRVEVPDAVEEELRSRHEVAP